MTDWSNIAVPEEDLGPQGYEPMPTGPYRTTLQSGTELVRNDKGWVAISAPFLGFAPAKGDGKAFPTATLNGRWTLEHVTSAKAVQIGVQGALALAHALGLTQTAADGKVSPTWATNEELVELVNACAGAEVEAYVKTGPRAPKFEGDVSHLRKDGTPWVDSEIKNVRALKPQEG